MKYISLWPIFLCYQETLILFHFPESLFLDASNRMVTTTQPLHHGFPIRLVSCRTILFFAESTLEIVLQNLEKSKFFLCGHQFSRIKMLFTQLKQAFPQHVSSPLRLLIAINKTIACMVYFMIIASPLFL